MTVRTVGLLCTIFFTQTAHADETCPSLSDTSAALRAAVSDARLEETEELAVQARAALLCQPEPMQPLLIGQTFQVIGAAAFFNGDIAGADDAFTWAASISPGSDLDSMYGKPAIDFYNKTRDRVVAAGGATIALKGGGTAWIDGRSLRPGVARDVTAGPHLIQTQEGEESPVVTKEIRLEGGADVVVTVGATADIAPAAFEEPETTTDRSEGPSQKVMLLGTGGALVATGTVLMVLAASAHQDFNNETDPSNLASLQSKTNTLGWAGVATGLTGVGVLGAGAFLGSAPGMGLTVRGRW